MSKPEAYRTLSNAVDVNIKTQLSCRVSYASPQATSTAGCFLPLFRTSVGSQRVAHHNYIPSMAPGSTREAYMQKINLKTNKLRGWVMNILSGSLMMNSTLKIHKNLSKECSKSFRNRLRLLL